MSDDDYLDDEDTEDDDLEPDYDDEPGSMFTGCCLGADCLNPHPYHFAYECFDLEMAKAAMDGDAP